MGMFCWCTFLVLAAFFLRQAMEKLIIISKRWWKRLLLLFGCWLLWGMVIYIGDPVNILLTIPFFLLTIQIACEGSFWKKITVGLMFSSTVFAFSALRDNFFLELYIRLRNARRAILLLRAALCTLPFSFFLYRGIRKFAPDEDYSLSDRMWKLLLLLTATPTGIVLSVVLLYDRYKMDRGDFAFTYGCFVLLIIALLSIIGLLWTITVLAKQQKLEEQNMLAEINRSYYEAMEQQHFAIRRMKHDLANHLSAALAMPDQQRELYIRSLTGEEAVVRSLQYCGDATVNAVLSVKEDQMKRCGIRLKAQIDIPGELPFEKTDICALFANALDNAAEACRELPEGMREVFLKSKAQKGLFCLEVANPVGHAGEKPEGGGAGAGKEGRLPETSKPDKENHGIGLKSIKEIVDRYHGEMDLRTKGESFELFLYIPVRRTL